jgi:hypothetical protein
LSHCLCLSIDLTVSLKISKKNQIELGERANVGSVDVFAQFDLRESSSLDDRFRLDNFTRTNRKQIQQRHGRNRRRIAKHLQKLPQSSNSYNLQTLICSESGFFQVLMN